ncbi:protein YIPF1-like [Ruditapes philippinarum]|uniref:protein YIPF1-like n=1 Tax=Ruditapes philippinarum TaxID=129788 RepID=UPI00295B3646|nr:protein YIPF1-like [Ruditapes philippinarum]
MLKKRSLKITLFKRFVCNKRETTLELQILTWKQEKIVIMSGKDGLDFHDSGGDDVLFDQSGGHTITFTNFPDSAVDDEDSGDKSQLLKEDGDKRAPSFWTFEYYQQFFDVETTQVFNRVAGSMMPLPKRNYLQANIRPNPDLYGPFWICTTLVFTTAIAGNLANYLSSAGKDYHWRYDFHKVTFAATAIFSYWWLIPATMYGFLWWRKSQAGFTFLEILCVYGYSLAIYIPISILWVINVTWLKWVLVVVGAVLSGGVLVITFWPAVKEETKNVAAVFLGLVFLLHLALAAGFVLYFFHVPPPITSVTTPAPATSPKPPLIPEKLKASVPAMISQKAGAPKLDTQNNGNLLNHNPNVGQNVQQNNNIDKGNIAAGNVNQVGQQVGQQAVNVASNTGNKSGIGGQNNAEGVQKIASDDKVRTKLDADNVKTNLERNIEKRDGRHKISKKI